MIQTGIDEGILVTWTKSFKCKNVVGKEVVHMLRQAFSKKKVFVKHNKIVLQTCNFLLLNV